MGRRDDLVQFLSIAVSLGCVRQILLNCHQRGQHTLCPRTRRCVVVQTTADNIHQFFTSPSLVSSLNWPHQLCTCLLPSACVPHIEDLTVFLVRKGRVLGDQLTQQDANTPNVRGATAIRQMAAV